MFSVTMHREQVAKLGSDVNLDLLAQAAEEIPGAISGVIASRVSRGAKRVEIRVTQLADGSRVEFIAASDKPGVAVSMDFGSAVAALKDGRKVARAGWNGKGMWLALQRPDSRSKMSLPYIYMSTAQGDLVPWLASQTDMLAEDWSLVGEVGK